MKVVSKEGYEPMLAHFQYQTTDTLHAAWVAHRDRYNQLGAAWRAAGKPTEPISEWLNE